MLELGLELELEKGSSFLIPARCMGCKSLEEKILFLCIVLPKAVRKSVGGEA